MVWWAFEQAGQDMLSALATPENNASRRVLEKLGFIYVDTRVFGSGETYGFFRFYHTDYIPGPEWVLRDLYKPEKMGDFFDSRADGYDEHMLSGVGGNISYKKLGGFFPKTNEALSILDIGCGTGIELGYIWENVPNAFITCLDISRGMLDLLLKNHPESHDHIKIVEASYISWDYPENAYDVVVSSVTMHHLWPDEKAGVYRKILNTLKPGGWYIEDDFIVDEIMAEQYRRRYEIVISNLPDADKVKAGEYHIDIPCSLDMQIKLLNNAGFSYVEILDENIQLSDSGAIIKAIK
jgi:tRNA (cmo5U34)-methyltransferase